MKKLHLFFALVLAISSIKAQESPIECLYEISGKDLEGKSYLLVDFGLNENELYNFSDSVQFAFIGSRIFLSSTNYDSIYLTTFGDGPGEQKIEEEKPSDNLLSRFLNIYNPDGASCPLDAYFYHMARYQEKVVSGVTNLANESPGDTFSLLAYGSELYDQYLDLLRNKNYQGATAFLEEHFPIDQSDYFSPAEIKRYCQAFLKHGTTAPTFAVLNINYALSSRGLIAQLESDGYKVRKVGTGEKQNYFDDLFELALETKYDLSPIPSDMLFSSYTRTGNPNVFFSEGSNYLGEMNWDRGVLYFFTAFVNTEEISKELVQSFYSSVMGTDEPITELQKKSETGGTWYVSKGGRAKLLTRHVYGNSVMQCILGMSKASVNENVMKEYESRVLGLTNEPEKSIHPREIGIDYATPLLKKMNIREVYHPEHSDREKAKIYSQTWIMPKTKNEYLVEVVRSPLGIMYNDTRLAARTTADVITARVSGKIINKEEVRLGKFQSFDYVINCDFSGIKTIYLRLIPLNSRIIQLIHFVRKGKKDQDFFDSFKFDDNIKWNLDTEVNVVGGLSFKYANDHAHNELNTIDKVINTESYQDDMTYSVMSVVTLKKDRYDSNNLTSADLAQYESEYKVELDSLIHFDSLVINGELAGYYIEYLSEGQNYYTAETFVYYDEYITSISTFQHLGVPSAYPREIFKSIKIKSDNDQINSNNAENIIEDLLSSDSSTFYTARENFSLYEDFVTSDSTAIISLMCANLMDDDEEGSPTKYMAVSDFYNIDYSLSQFTRVYGCQKSSQVKGRLLNSLALKNNETSLELLFKLLHRDGQDIELEDATYDVFRQDFDTFYKYYDDLLGLAKKGISTRSILETIVNWNLAEYDLEKLVAHRTSFDSEIAKLSEEFIKDSAKDSLIELPAVIMDYFLLVDDHPDEQRLYKHLRSTNSLYGKYRTVYNQYLKEMSIDTNMLKEVAADPYYLYWITQLLHEEEIYTMTPELSRTRGVQAISTLTALIQDYLGVVPTTCKVFKQIDIQVKGKTMDMDFVGCKYDESENYLFGMIGPYTAEGIRDVKNDNSNYYDTPATKLDMETIIEAFQEYLNNQE